MLLSNAADWFWHIPVMELEDCIPEFQLFENIVEHIPAFELKTKSNMDESH